MVRCSRCEKSFKQHSGRSWDANICNKCWKQGERLDYQPPKVSIRMISNPFDHYLDLYTWREMEKMKR